MPVRVLFDVLKKGAVAVAGQCLFGDAGRELLCVVVGCWSECCLMQSGCWPGAVVVFHAIWGLCWCILLGVPLKRVAFVSGGTHWECTLVCVCVFVCVCVCVCVILQLFRIAFG